MERRLKQNIDKLYQRILEIIDNARDKVYRTANSEMVQTYWNIGREIVEEEQKGKERATYGDALLQELSEKLTKQCGKNFSNRNLRYMRQFYRIFPKWNAVRSELSWTHYRLLLRIEKETAREYYLKEAIECNWSTRTLERQINSLYYERLLMSGKKNIPQIKEEAENKKEKMLPEHIIKDPYVLDFLELKPNQSFY